MAEGFYVTNKGIELINQAVTAGTKVDIKKVQYGSGGDSVSPWNYDIESLGHQEYAKDLDPNTDYYKVSESDPKTFIITTIVPNNIECTINEIGYFDSQDNLIIYGIVREEQKRAGIKFQYETYVKFDNIDDTGVEIVIASPEYEQVEKLLAKAEKEFDLTNYIRKDELGGIDLTELKGEVDQLKTKVGEVDISGLETRVGTIETDLDGFLEVLKETVM